MIIISLRGQVVFYKICQLPTLKVWALVVSTFIALYFRANCTQTGWSFLIICSCLRQRSGSWVGTGHLWAGSGVESITEDQEEFKSLQMQKNLIYFSMTQMCGMQRRQLLKSFKSEPKVKNVIGSFKGRILIWTKINRIRSILSHFVMLLLFLSFIYLNLSCLFLFLPYLSEMTIFSHSN